MDWRDLGGPKTQGPEAANGLRGWWGRKELRVLRRLDVTDTDT